MSLRRVLTVLRSDCEWELLWQEIVAFANHHNIQMSQSNRSRRQRRTPAALEGFIIAETTGDSSHQQNEQSSESFKVNVYFPTIDVILAEMKERFSSSNISLLKSVACLDPKSPFALAFV